MSENTEKNKASMVLGTIGALGGLYYAFTKKKGFWGYVGFFILGSLSGSLLGSLFGNSKKSTNNQPINNQPIGGTTPTKSEKITEIMTCLPLLMDNQDYKPTNEEIVAIKKIFNEKFTDEELNTWLKLCKALKDQEMQDILKNKGKEEFYKSIEKKYALKEAEITKLYETFMLSYFGFNKLGFNMGNQQTK